jgi:hypothetical protein
MTARHQEAQDNFHPRPAQGDRAERGSPRKSQLFLTSLSPAKLSRLRLSLIRVALLWLSLTTLALSLEPLTPAWAAQSLAAPTQARPASDQRKASQAELARLLSLKPAKEPQETIQSQTLAKVAYKVALETGGRARYAEILAALEPLAPELDEIFDFTPLIKRQGRLFLEPPVVFTIWEKVTLNGQAAARGQGLTHQLIRTGRFLGQVPHWRDYLLTPHRQTLPEPDGVHGSLRPTNAQEREIWRQEILRGWRAGQATADLVFHEAVSLLVRDYLGLMSFYDLERQGLVQGPSVKEAQVPFQVGPEQMLWDQTEFLITAPGQFVAPPKTASPSSDKSKGSRGPNGSTGSNGSRGSKGKKRD